MSYLDLDLAFELGFERAGLPAVPLGVLKRWPLGPEVHSAAKADVRFYAFPARLKAVPFQNSWCPLIEWGTCLRLTEAHQQTNDFIESGKIRQKLQERLSC